MSIFRKILAKPQILRSCFALNSKEYSSGNLFEPDYLQAMKSKIPLYDVLNIQISGYDYPVLESYQKFLHKLLKNMDINVEECWATPAQHMQISTYKPNSDVVNARYLLKVYNRTVQITDVSTLQLPIVLRMLESSLPAGVTVNVKPHDPSDEEVRYIPDSELITLKDELDTLGGPKSKK
ncbi:hypothetical protein NQ317_006034 [Molorchus minor]|uniref:Small ribosomal subunit protein uS10 domain-containing protein n=1 Tax=Molorchus minor TaxID=1323400 RepID=A0ABQ9K3K2_9CUCU|nr:hypothetical protein NQ317_006034 [Molorchus minor]